MKLNVGLICFGYPNFRVDIAKKTLDKSIELLKKEDINLISHDEVIVDASVTNKVVQDMKLKNIDLLIIQNGTFSDGNHIIKIIENLKDTPILLWGLPEPKAGEFKYIALNSMTAFNMFTSFLYKYKVSFNYVFGNVEDAKVQKGIKDNIEALKVNKKLRNSKFCIIGGRAPGFYLSNVDELRFRKEIGPEIVYYSLAQLLNDVKELDEAIIKEVVEEINKTGRVTSSSEALEKTARVYLAIKKFIKSNNVQAFTIKCWPEMQSLYNFAPCTVLSKFNSEGIMASCEGDIPGLVTMYIQNILTDKSVFFADLVNVNDNGTVKLWHCGCAPYKLACDEKKIEFTQHPTIKNGIGMSVEFEMNKGRLVMCKFKEDDEKYKLLIAPGTGVKEDRVLTGNQADIKFDADNEKLLRCIVENGIEHHYSIVYEDIVDKLEVLCKWMNIEAILCKE
ncbi:L-fucose/L-arabinose isomerase family protein [Haloimpatiens sp. FM7330]|uniref:L-fucose/L-arabinose isomerase family protein n=1 Tax=Haloimpatiens sp. FM7330 TaxID=3298610 RepID=UPI003631B8C6